MTIKDNTTHLNDPLLFLVVCSKADLSDEDVKFIQLFLGEEKFQTRSLLMLASQHGILPLIYKSLNRLDINNQEQLLQDLKSSYTQIVQRNMLMSAELIRIMKLLEDNGIDAMAFKGPTLSQMIYNDITLRQYSDLDILIDISQVSLTAKLLQENHYSLLYPQKVLSNETCLDTLIDVGFLHNHILIELHWKLLQTKHTGRDSLSEPQNYKNSIMINNTKINTLDNELLLVYLCLHGSKHAWERIEWICDIDRLIRTKEFDWDKSIEIASSSKLKRAFFLGLELAHDFYNTPLPETILNKIKKDDIQTLKQITILHLNDTLVKKSDFLRNKKIFLYQLELFESFRDKTAFILDSFFNISPADCIAYPLPKKLKFLYLFLRPVRLGWNYGKKLFHIKD